jgi:hypothetical protein
MGEGPEVGKTMVLPVVHAVFCDWLSTVKKMVALTMAVYPGVVQSQLTEIG